MAEAIVGKVCTRCKVEKPLEAFTPQRNGALGRTAWCRECLRLNAAVKREERRRLLPPPPKLIGKICPICKTDKPLSEFGVQRSKPDGRTPQCRECRRQIGKTYRSSEGGKRAARAYFLNNKERCYGYTNKRVNTAAWREEQRRYRQSDKGKAMFRRRFQNSRNKCYARNAVNAAVKQGSIPSPKTLPCCECGQKAREYHHHKGYDRANWLNVVAVCKKCHILLDSPPLGPTPELLLREGTGLECLTADVPNTA